MSHNGHLYPVLLPLDVSREALIEAMSAVGVPFVFHYVPLHSSPAGRKYGRTDGELPVTDRVAESLVRLPLYYGMGAARDRVIEALTRHLVG